MSTSPPSRVRRLSRRTQILVVLGVAAAIAVLVAAGAAFRHFLAPPPQPKQPASAPGTFRPTKEQWAGLKVVDVQTRTFRTEQITDGNIAINEDTNTPVFSPYSGRVTRVIAKLGDNVKAGDPLMAVEASEFVQGQNDLASYFSNIASRIKLNRKSRDGSQCSTQGDHFRPLMRFAFEPALYVLAAGAVLAGFVAYPWFVGKGWEHLTHLATAHLLGYSQSQSMPKCPRRPSHRPGCSRLRALRLRCWAAVAGKGPFLRLGP